jgi:hypothetical protein
MNECKKSVNENKPGPWVPALQIKIFLEIESDFCEKSHAVITHLHGIKRSAGFAVPPRGILGADGCGEIRMNIKQVINTDHPGYTPVDLIGQI